MHRKIHYETSTIVSRLDNKQVKRIRNPLNLEDYRKKPFLVIRNGARDNPDSRNWSNSHLRGIGIRWIKKIKIS